MSGELVNHLVRRAVVLGASIAVIAVAVGTVRVAADWRAAEAPLDVAPSRSTRSSADLAETD
jgi:hypothetical protein